MSERDDRPAGDAEQGTEPPAKNALRAGFGYLVVLAIVLTGLAAWFVLTRTAANPMG